ncbi:MAG: hypothetical protein V1776_02055 [Candidatus Diapherotrites archaeon]
MRPLSRIGWFSAGIGIILLIIAFWHAGGFDNTGMGITQLLGTLFWGGIAWAGILIIGMAILFLSA